MKIPKLSIELIIPLLYLLFGGLWILLSDRALAAVVSDPGRLTSLQTYKGWAFVACGALLLYVLLRWALPRQRSSIEALYENDVRFRQLFETSRDAIMLTAPDGSIYAANPAACRIFNRTQEEICLVGRNGLLDANDPRVALALEERSRTGYYFGELTFLRKFGGKFPGEISTSVFTDHHGYTRSSMIIRDISERKQAEAKILHLNRLYNSLSQINQVIVRVHDQAALFKEICRVIIEYGQFYLCWIGLVDESQHTVRMVCYDGLQQISLRELTIQYLDEHQGGGPTGAAVRAGRVEICEDVANDPHMLHWREQAQSFGVRSSAAVPIRQHGRIIGTLTVYSTQVHDFDRDDEKLLDEIGGDISYALDALAAEAERQAMETAVAASRDHLYRILNGITDAFIVLDKDWRITYINAEAARINKKPPEEFLGHTHWEEWPASLGTIVEENYRKAMAERCPVHFEHRYFVDGSYDVWLDIHAYPNEDGLAIYYRDISEQKQAEAARRASEANLKKAQVVANLGNWVWHIQSNRLEWSDQMYVIFGIEKEKFTGNLADVIQQSIHPDDRDAVNASNESVTRGRPYPVEYRTIRPDGSIRTVWAEAGELIMDEHGQPQTLTGIVQDITERKRAEQEIRELNTVLEKRVQERTAQLQITNDELVSFSYSVSHDLRAPLRALRGYSSFLAEEYGAVLDEQGRHYLARIQDAAQQMNDLMDALLNLSRVTQRAINPQPVNLSLLANQIIAELRSSDPQRSVEVGIADNLVVQGDVHLLRIALENLLNNAWKYTCPRPLAHIELGVMAECPGAHTAGPGPVYFVRDDGAGFDMTYASKLFVPFQRLHNAHEFPGNGVGLATVQRIILRHGGRVWAESAVDQGSTFYFTLNHTS